MTDACPFRESERIRWHRTPIDRAVLAELTKRSDPLKEHAGLSLSAPSLDTCSPSARDGLGLLSSEMRLSRVAIEVR